MDAYAHRIAIARRFGSRIAAGDAVFQTGAAAVGALPCTVSDGVVRQMSGPNLFVLLQVMVDRGWADSRFFTADQVQQAGWTIAPAAAGVRLQFLVATGSDGLPLEAPGSRTFMVFNAGEIEGVPKLDMERVVDTADLEAAALTAGFGGRKIDLDGWLRSLHGMDSETKSGAAADISLRSGLAKCLLSVQTGLPFVGAQYKEFAAVWADGVESDPLSFFQAVRDAEKLSARVMAEMRLVAQERLAAAMIAPAPSLASTSVMEGVMVAGRNGRGVARVARMFEERVAVLAVPFTDKERAAVLGAVWFAPQKLWFVPKGLDVGVFKEWNPRTHVLGPVASRESLIDLFRDAMLGMGLDAPVEIKDDGKWHNVRVDANKGNNMSGSYILSLDAGRNGEAIGTIMNKFSGESFTWKHEGALLTPEQKARMRAEVLAREEASAREGAIAQEVAARHAGEIWALGRGGEGHGYVVRKGIDADGLRQVSGSVLLRFPEFIGEGGKSIIRAHEDYLLVPMTNSAGELRAVQAISEDGVAKSFMRGAQKKGTMMVLGAESFDALCGSGVAGFSYTEGLATGKSFQAGSGLSAVVCFDAGNLETVVAETADKVPLETLRVLAVDNDQFHVERAVGFLADRLGLNPHGLGGQVVEVASGVGKVRPVSLGDAVADGEWHQVAKGAYRVVLALEDEGVAVRSVSVEVVPVGGRRMRSKFENRGMEAGRVALASIEAAGGLGLLAVPEFKSLVGRPTDWNDLVKRDGGVFIRAGLGLVAPVVELEKKGLELRRGIGVGISR